jgi:hypothetical protein
MRFFAVLLLLALPAVAQDANKMLEQAKKLEARAEKLLDQGKRAEAFDTLARASELREKAKAAAPASAKPKKKLKKRKSGPAEIAHTELDRALKAGNVPMAQKASDKLRKARAAQAKRISALEKQLRRMEQQLAEIRRMLDIEKPG